MRGFNAGAKDRRAALVRRPNIAVRATWQLLIYRTEAGCLLAEHCRPCWRRGGWVYLSGL